MPERQTTTAAAEATATDTVVASSAKNVQHQNNPILSIFSNFLKIFNLVPPHPQKKKVGESAASDNRQPSKAEPVVGEFDAETKPTVVTFPRHNDDESLPSLKLKPDEVEERDTNPVVLWQVYAIGGFLIMKWAWTRWNERKGRKKPSGEEPPPAVE